MPAHRSPGPLVGERFGRFVVVSPEVSSIGGKIYWLCRCDTGGELVLLKATRLRRGRTARCRCSQSRGNQHAVRHGHTAPSRGGRTPEYKTWMSLRSRCLDPKNRSWAYYGGRGITVCRRWRDSFAAFLADMGPRPAGHTIDRVDADGHYEPGNCRWATAREQQHNRRDRQPQRPAH